MKIAVVGLPGSGKSEVINYIQERYGLAKVYFGDVTFDEMKKRNLPINEKNERQVREDLRQKFGTLHYAKETIKKIDEIAHKHLLIESLYTFDEYQMFKEKFIDDFCLIAVSAPPKIRYSRLSARPVRPLSLEEAKSRDYAQVINLTQGGPIAMADYTVLNTTTLKDMHVQVDAVMKEIL